MAEKDKPITFRPPKGLRPWLKKRAKESGRDDITKEIIFILEKERKNG